MRGTVLQGAATGSDVCSGPGLLLAFGWLHVRAIPLLIAPLPPLSSLPLRLPASPQISGQEEKKRESIMVVANQAKTKLQMTEDALHRVQVGQRAMRGSAATMQRSLAGCVPGRTLQHAPSAEPGFASQVELEKTQFELQAKKGTQQGWGCGGPCRGARPAAH